MWDSVLERAVSTSILNCEWKLLCTGARQIESRPTKRSALHELNCWGFLNRKLKEQTLGCESYLLNAPVLRSNQRATFDCQRRTRHEVKLGLSFHLKE